MPLATKRNWEECVCLREKNLTANWGNAFDWLEKQQE